MKYWALLFVLFVNFGVSADDKVDYEKNLVALHEKISFLTEEIESLKEQRKLEIQLITESSRSDTSDLDWSQFVTTNQFAEMSHSVLSRVDSTDESVGSLLTFIGNIATAWGFIVTFLMGGLVYLHFGSLKKAISENESRLDSSIREHSSKIDAWLNTTALDKIESIASEAEERLERVSNREKIARQSLSKSLEANVSITASETTQDQESHSQQLKSAIRSYKEADFPVAILTSKLVLEKDIDLKQRIEATKIIANSYQALNLNELSIKYNEKLQEWVTLYSHGKPSSLGAATQLNVVMNKYPIDTSKNNHDTIELIDALVSSYIRDSDVEVVRSVAKARMLKAIVHENNGSFLNAISIYESIIEDYKGHGDQELVDIVATCQGNLQEIKVKTRT
ncbi:hypothetical protein [Pseudoalteromonas sp. H105]|uniref:hypothetical protein n=1 Tax=Pseudoalteromonas sp. H105 TaxID=1348393 RepID=UPI0007322EB0|nr:hypothetical protein [Pseudoalteromonas sp. H105]KTF16664.1 hypothetical protein ATS75_04225 [Pseudoalteromonas sp. H105]